MSTPTTHAEVGEESLARAFVRGWGQFWFRPADPTPLGLVRICAGLVVLYIHLGYCLDLQSFFGPNAWIRLADLNDFRENAPWSERQFGWRETPDYRGPSSPDAEAEKAYMLKWDGLHPSLAHARGYYSWSIWYHVTDPAWMRVVHGANLLIFFFLTIGFCTRVTSVLAWLAAMSYIQRSPTTLFGLDTISNYVLLYLMIGPSGAALSVDRLVRRYVMTWRGLRARGSVRKAGSAAESPAGDRPEPSVSANVALRLLQIHVCFVYMASGLSKLQGNAWWLGTSTWATMINYEFSPVHFRPYAAYLRFICEHRWLWEVIMQGGVLFTLIFEISFAFVVWNRWLRWPMILSAVLLHTGIAVFMGLTTFSLMMLTAVASFVPPEAIHRLVDGLGRGPGGLRLAFAGRSRRQLRLASLVHAFDVWDQIELAEPARPRAGTPSADVSSDTAELAWPKNGSDEAAGLRLVTEKGEALTGYPLFERVVRSLRLLWPVAALTWVPGVAGLAKSRYPGEGRAAAAVAVNGEKGRAKGEKVAS